MALPRDGWWRERSEGELILGGCSHFTLKPEAWLSLWARVSISGEEASEATSLPFILLQSEIPVAKAKRALGQVQEEHSCEACRSQNPSKQPAALIPGFWHVSGLGQTSKLSCLLQETRSHRVRTGYRWISRVCSIVCGCDSHVGGIGQDASSQTLLQCTTTPEGVSCGLGVLAQHRKMRPESRKAIPRPGLEFCISTPNGQNTRQIISIVPY